MCRQHNAYVAELDYGKERIERYRRRGHRVFETMPLAMFGESASRAGPTPPTSMASLMVVTGTRQK
jgi:hypothetical protein